MAIGFVLPFTRSTGSVGYFETTDDQLSAVRQDIKSLLLTNWGERVMHYQFGCNFKDMLFENASVDEHRERVADRVLSQIQMWLPFVQVRELNVSLGGENGVPENAMKVAIVFSLVSSPDLTSRLVVDTRTF